MTDEQIELQLSSFTHNTKKNPQKKTEAQRRCPIDDLKKSQLKKQSDLKPRDYQQ